MTPLIFVFGLIILLLVSLWIYALDGENLESILLPLALVFVVFIATLNITSLYWEQKIARSQLLNQKIETSYVAIWEISPDGEKNIVYAIQHTSPDGTKIIKVQE